LGVSLPDTPPVTVHQDDCPAFAEIRRRYQKREESIDRPSLLLYRIIDGLVDSFFTILADFDNRIDELENAIFLHADDRQLQEIFQMKRLLVGMVVPSGASICVRSQDCTTAILGHDYERLRAVSAKGHARPAGCRPSSVVGRAWIAQAQ
jgi:CorA-like Mg2+ transporter protein